MLLCPENAETLRMLKYFEAESEKLLFMLSSRSATLPKRQNKFKTTNQTKSNSSSARAIFRVSERIGTLALEASKAFALTPYDPQVPRSS